MVRTRDGVLKAFYNVCKHRAHELLQGEGRTARITCPYHAWTYDLGGRLIKAPHTEALVDFDPSTICLDEVQVEAFCGFIYVNLDPDATPLAEQSGQLGEEIRRWAPDVDRLTFAHRLTYDIKSNWKNVVDNFLECYHCPVAHKDFCTLVDMDTYKVTTHGIYSSHMAEAGKAANTAYSVEGATVKDHAVWFLWPNTCLMRYPGRGNFIIMHIIPAGPERTLETYDFFFETADANPAEKEAIRYIDDVLQPEDIGLVESVQRGMKTPRSRKAGSSMTPKDRANPSMRCIISTVLCLALMSRRRACERCNRQAGRQNGVCHRGCGRHGPGHLRALSQRGCRCCWRRCGSRQYGDWRHC